MSRSAFSLATSRLSCAISNCSGFIWPWPGNACCGSSASCFTQLRNCVGWTPRSSDACAYDTPRSLISRTASSLNSRVNCRLSMTHLLLHKTPNSVSSEPGAAQAAEALIESNVEVVWPQVVGAIRTRGEAGDRQLALEIIALSKGAGFSGEQIANAILD